MREIEFLMIKPDGVQRGLVGEIVARFEKAGLKLVAMKLIHVSKEQAEEHYSEHKGKGFYNPLLEYITSGPVVCMVIEGANVVKLSRKIVGATNPVDAAPGTIRGDFALEIGRNVIHAGDSVESAKREIGIYFKKEEIQNYSRIDEPWLYE